MPGSWLDELAHLSAQTTSSDPTCLSSRDHRASKRLRVRNPAPPRGPLSMDIFDRRTIVFHAYSVLTKNPPELSKLIAKEEINF